MSTASYDQLTKEQLVELLLERDRDTESNPHRKKYGLIWEDKPEQFEADSIGRIPVLQRDAEKCIFTSPDRPTHVLIQGDNYHALKVLTYTHERSVDVIYIDPPYNTGKDFIYKDNFYPAGRLVKEDDNYRHSKWLSFMSKRLRLSRRLLKHTGVILVSIDEHEVFNLKLLMDDIWSEACYVGMFIWNKKKVKAQSKTLSSTCEYVLVYKAHPEVIVPFREKKTGVSALKEKAAQLMQACHGNTEEASRKLRTWIAKQGFKRGVEIYNQIDVNGEIYSLNSTIAALSKGSGHYYDLTHPELGFTLDTPSNGWAYQLNVVLDMYRAGAVRFFDTPSKLPSKVNYLKDFETQPMTDYIEEIATGSADLERLGMKGLFDNPKPVALLKTLLSSFPSDATILDFFAGSGSLAEAVLELNGEDGGRRQFILVTNDEGEFFENGQKLDGGICTNVTYPRVRKVLEKARPSTENATITQENLSFYVTEFVLDRAVERYRRELSSRSAELLALREACPLAEDIPDKRWRSFTDGKGKRLVVVSDEFAAADLVPLLKADKRETVVYVFRFGDDEDPANEYGGEGLEHVTAKPVPDSLLALHRRIQKQEVKAV